MLREFIVRLEFDDYDENEKELNSLFKKKRSLDYLMFKCNFAGYGDIGDMLMDHDIECNKRVLNLIRKFAVDYFETDKNGKKIKINTNFSDEDENEDK